MKIYNYPYNRTVSSYYTGYINKYIYIDIRIQDVDFLVSDGSDGGKAFTRWPFLPSNPTAEN